MQLVVDDHGGHVGASRGDLGQRGRLQIAEDGHGDGPRDGGRGHHQGVRALLGLGRERRALLDPEAVLLVDHHQPEVGELRAGGQQRVGADHDPGLPRGGRQGGLAPTTGRHRSGDQRDAGARRAGGQQVTADQVTQHRGDRPMMLGGEHLGGRQQRGLTAVVHHRQHGPQRHHGLAGAHLALQQPLHRVRPGEVGEQLVADLLLPLRQLERQRRVERVQQAAGDAGPRHGSVRRRQGATASHGELQPERLVELHPGQTGGDLVFGVGAMHRPVRRRLAHQIRLAPHPLRQRILHPLQAVQGQRDAAGDRPGPQLGGRRVETDPTGGTGHLAQVEVALGSADDVAVLVDDDEVGVGELRLPPERPHLAGEDPTGPGPELGLPVVDQVLGPEEGQVELAPTVGDDRLETELAGSARGLAHAVHRGVPHLGEHGDVITLGQVAQIAELGARDVPAGQVQHQVADRAQLQRLERLGRLATQHPAQGDGEPGEAGGAPELGRRTLGGRRGVGRRLLPGGLLRGRRGQLRDEPQVSVHSRPTSRG